MARGRRVLPDRLNADADFALETATEHDHADATPVLDALFSLDELPARSRIDEGNPARVTRRSGGETQALILATDERLPEAVLDPEEDESYACEDDEAQACQQEGGGDPWNHVESA